MEIPFLWDFEHPENWGFQDPIWAYFLGWVGEKPPIRYGYCHDLRGLIIDPPRWLSWNSSEKWTSTYSRISIIRVGSWLRFVMDIYIYKESANQWNFQPDVRNSKGWEMISSDTVKVRVTYRSCYSTSKSHHPLLDIDVASMQEDHFILVDDGGFILWHAFTMMPGSHGTALCHPVLADQGNSLSLMKGSILEKLWGIPYFLCS